MSMIKAGFVVPASAEEKGGSFLKNRIFAAYFV